MTWGQPRGGRYAVASREGWLFAFTAHAQEFDDDPIQYAGGMFTEDEKGVAPDCVYTWATLEAVTKELSRVPAWDRKDWAIVELKEV